MITAERLTERDVTVEEVRQWIRQEFIDKEHPYGNLMSQDPDEFITEQSLANFWWLFDWWACAPKRPGNLGDPLIQTFCWNIQYGEQHVPLTFDQCCAQYYQKCVAYCKLEGLDPANLSETKEERRRRLNRERMRRQRGGEAPVSKDTPNSSPNPELDYARGEMARLQEEAKQADAEFADRVRYHYNEMTKLSADRKHAKDYYRSEIDKVREIVNSLIAKQ